MKANRDRSSSARCSSIASRMTIRRSAASRSSAARPFNVAWHLQAFGLASALPQPRRSTTRRGARSSPACDSWGMDVSGVQVDSRPSDGCRRGSAPPMASRVTTILADQAYDHIARARAACTVADPDALALPRDARTAGAGVPRRARRRPGSGGPASAARGREPARAVVGAGKRSCAVRPRARPSIKLNEHELAQLADAPGDPIDRGVDDRAVGRGARARGSRTPCSRSATSERLVVTRGERGADRWSFRRSRGTPVESVPARRRRPSSTPSAPAMPSPRSCFWASVSAGSSRLPFSAA